MLDGAFPAAAADRARRLLRLKGWSDTPASGFAALRWTEGSCIPFFWHGGGWHQLADVNGVAAHQLVTRAAELAGRDWQRLMLADMGRILALDGVTDAAAQECWTISSTTGTGLKASVTGDNLASSIWYFLCHGETAGPDTAPDLVAAKAGLSQAADADDKLSPAQVECDLLLLDRLVRDEYAYWWIASQEYVTRHAALLDAARAATAPLSRNQHVIDLRDLMVLLDDGHTRVNSSGSDLLSTAMAPFQLDWIGARLVAVSADRARLLDDDFPFVAAIAGRPLADWKRAAADGVPRGTSSMRRCWMARELRRIGLLAGKLGVTLPEDGRVVLTLADEAGRATRDLEVTLRPDDPRPAIPPVTGGIVAGDLGYIALRAGMVSDPDAIAEAHRLMRSFAQTRGIIIDIRDNPGGSRDLLRAVAGYLVAPGAAHVTSWARLRRGAGQDPDAGRNVLQKRYMRPWDSADWSQPARAAAAAFAADFAAEWPKADDAAFGPLNLLIAERLPEHGDLHLAQPVVQLFNLRNYSASDIFASSIAALPGVVSLGTPTAGGSGFARKTVLPASGIEIQISTMASGMINGDLYERRGVMPDEIIEPALSQWREGQTGDPVMQRAIARLHESNHG